MDLFHQTTANMCRRSVKKNYPLSSQKNENDSSIAEGEDERGNGGAEAHKEKLPLTII
jgi:hypothetical protein